MADPSITDGEIATAVKWIGGTVVSIVTILGGILGVNKLAELRLKRRYTSEDKATEIHETNQGKSIDADAAAFQIFASRLTIVEADLKDVSRELRTAMADNATLTADNKHLGEDNSRLRTKITELETHIRNQDGIIADLRREVDILKLTVAHYHADDGKIDQPIDVRLVNDEDIHITGK